MISGFISLDEIENVWTTFLRDLDEVVMPVDGPLQRDAIMEHCQNLKYELGKRSKRSIEEWMAKGPVHVEPARKAAPANSMQSDYLRHQDRLTNIRNKAGLGQ